MEPAKVPPSHSPFLAIGRGEGTKPVSSHKKRPPTAVFYFLASRLLATRRHPVGCLFFVWLRGAALCVILPVQGARILRCREKARTVPLEGEYQTTAVDDLRFHGHRRGLRLPDAGQIRYRRRVYQLYPFRAVSAAFRVVGLYHRPAHYTEAGAALSAPDGAADAPVAGSADAEIPRGDRRDGGAVCVVSLLSADAVSPAAGGVYRSAAGKAGGIPPAQTGGAAGHHPHRAVPLCDHQ